LRPEKDAPVGKLRAVVSALAGSFSRVVDTTTA
jgi:hypothetical protein